MIFIIEGNNFANITFNGGSRVSSMAESQYLVKWFRDETFVGEMRIEPGCWGWFPIEFGNWKIEFWRESQMVNSYENNLSNNFVLLSAKFHESAPGKSVNIQRLKERLENIQEIYGCKTVCYFPNSERYSLPETIIPFRLNDKYDFKLMIEEWIA